MVAEGATVVVTGKPGNDDGQAVADRLAPNGWFAELDVTDEARCSVADEVVARHGRLDVRFATATGPPASRGMRR